MFVRPALRRMIGVEPLNRPLVRARLHERVVSNPGIRSYTAGWLAVEGGAYTVRPIGGSTPTIAALASGNALIVVPEEVTAIESGEAATVMALDKRQP